MNSLIPEFDESLYFIVSGNKSGLYVKKFGYEIEGSFNDDIAQENQRECECSSDTLDNYGCECGANRGSCYDNKYFKEDGSVHCNRTYTGSEDLTEGEIASPVWRIDRMFMMKKFVEKNTPSYVDKTAGIHVSISTNCDLAYEKLMDKKFFKLFRKSVKVFMNSIVKNNDDDWTFLFSSDTRKRFNDRFNGTYDTYCKNSYASDSQVNPSWNKLIPNRQGRYNCMSYPHHHNGRLECRMFPSSADPKEVVLMVEWFVNFTNEYLNTFIQKERALNLELEIDEAYTERSEELLICV